MNKTGKFPLIRRSDRSRESLNSTIEPFSKSLFTPRTQKEFPIRFLQPSREKRGGSMEAYNGPLGPNARLEFYDTFMNLPLFSQRNKEQKLENTPNVAYLQQVHKQHLAPEPFGIVRNKGPKTSIDIHQYGMGDSYAEAFSEAICIVKDIETLNLKDNRLSDSGAAKILNRLISRNMKRIIMSDNKISTQSISCIVRILTGSESRIKVLELENTHLSDRSVISLCRTLTENKMLMKLSLAKNNISESCTSALAEMLKYNQTLRDLDLHWNSLGNGGAIVFCEGLSQNDGLKHLDLSWNLLGRNDGFATAKALAKALSVNQTLQHLDLSNNYIKEKECEIIGEGLKDNHHIFGLHMQGNDCTVDAKGYIKPIAYLNKTEQAHLYKRIISKSKFKGHQIARDNCWICEKWVEIEFSWRPEKSGPIKEPPFYVHLDLDNFGPSQTTKVKEAYSVTRMVPPGVIKFFFSADSTLMTSQEYKTKILETSLRIEFPGADGLKNHMNISKVNTIYIETEDWDAKGPSVKPRNDPRIKEWTEIRVVKIPWDINQSSFKDYRFDTDEVLQRCCGFDFDVSNIREILPDIKIREEVKGLLQGHYRLLTEAFKQLSAISGIELFAISKNILNEFIKKCDLFSSDFTANDVGILWNLSNAPQSKGEIFNAGNGLCRYEFAEFMVRLAIDRFYKTKKCATIREAFEQLLHNHAIPGLKLYDMSTWRTNVYLNEDVDCVLKAFRPVLEAIFVKYSALGRGSIDKMNLHEFRLFCTDARLINDNFPVREIDMCFRQAMMTEIDEILDGDHLEMVYVEFIEALSRVADLVNSKNHEMDTLDKKLEALIPTLMKVCPINTSSVFELPSKETFYQMKFVKKLVTVQEYIPAK